jgi:hypothetical protein
MEQLAIYGGFVQSGNHLSGDTKSPMASNQVFLCLVCYSTRREAPILDRYGHCFG